MKMKKATRMFISAVMVIMVSITTIFGLPAISDGFSVIVYAADDLTDSITGVTLKDTNGDGYYEIGTAAELKAFSNLVNHQGKDSLNVVLTADIVMPQGEEWQPIGYYNDYNDFEKYIGKFDGQCHIISGLVVNDPNKSYVGLFGTITAEAEIKNVGVVNSTFNGKYYVAGICGEQSDHTNIKNCFSVCSITGNDVYTGGITGSYYKYMSNCYSLENYTEDDFRSGKITYLLNEGKSDSDPKWYQTIGSSDYPGSTGEEVYYIDGEYLNHQHNYSYSVSGNTITASCGVAGCDKQGRTITISVNDKAYDGTSVTANITNNVNTTNYSSVVEYRDNENNIMTNAPAAVGNYTASLTVGGKTASVDFEITKVTPNITITAVDESAVNNTIDVSVVAKNPNNNSLNDLPSITLTYQVGAGSTPIPFTGSFNIPNDASVGEDVIITAKTEANDNYNAVTKTHTIEIIECHHENALVEWTKDVDGHWHECTCGGKVAYNSHIPGAEPTIDTPQTCTVCGYVLKSETGVGPFVVEGGNKNVDYTYENNVLIIKTSTPLTIRNIDPNVETGDEIKILGGIDADITFAGVNIRKDEIDDIPLFILDYGNNNHVKITLAEGTKNYLIGGYKAGINKESRNSTLEITGLGYLYATGTSGAAGIGGEDYTSCSNIIISGGCITASSIGAGIGGTSSNIIITGGSVKGDVNGIPHDGNNNDLYLLKINNPNSLPVYVNGSVTPYELANHTLGGESDTNLYLYLPAKDAQNPNVIKVGDVIYKYCYNTAENRWLEVVENPEADNTEFVYDNTEKTYSIAEREYYEISDNTTQKNAGTYTITVALKNGYIWNDGTLEDKEYTFVIEPKTIKVIAQNATKVYGNSDPELTYIVEGIISGDNLNGELSRESGEAVDTYTILQNTITNTNNPNYSITFVSGTLEITPVLNKTILDDTDDVVDIDGPVVEDTDIPLTEDNCDYGNILVMLGISILCVLATNKTKYKESK